MYRPDFHTSPLFPNTNAENPTITLKHGDVLTLAAELAPETVDLVIADPPYCSGAGGAGAKADPVAKYCQSGNSLGRPTFTGDARDQRSLAYWSTLWLGHCLAAAKPSAYCLVFTDWRQLPTFTDALQAGGWTWRGTIVWDKGRGSRSPHKGYFRHQCEYLIWGTKGKVPMLKDRGPFDGCYSITNKLSDKHHITGKPTELLRRLVQAAPVGGLVLDPFAGSGTTGVACQLENRRFLGFELSEEYFDIACSRLETNMANAA